MDIEYNADIVQSDSLKINFYNIFWYRNRHVTIILIAKDNLMQLNNLYFYFQLRNSMNTKNVYIYNLLYNLANQTVVNWHQQ